MSQRFSHASRFAIVIDEISPDMMTSRGMIATTLYRLAGLPDISDENLGYPFTDVDASTCYGTAVYRARLASVAGGYSNGNFGPNDPITMEQLAVMLMRFFELLIQE